jgi:hypothetical protein
VRLPTLYSILCKEFILFSVRDHHDDPHPLGGKIRTVRFDEGAMLTALLVKGKAQCNINNMSSAAGLPIAMSEFSQIELSAGKKSVRIGTDLDQARFTQSRGCWRAISQRP